jgi:hypothetical protein
MNERFRFYSFIGTLITLAFMFLVASLLAWTGRSVEAIGIGGALTGLIGLAGVLAGARTPAAGTTQTGDVNVETKQ